MGSEMCIRDRPSAGAGKAEVKEDDKKTDGDNPVGGPLGEH